MARKEVQIRTKLAMLCRDVPFEERIGLKDNMSVLDVGCGYGEILSRLNADDAFRVGLDMTKNKLINGHDDFANVNFVFGDVSFLPFRNATFDVVMSRQAVSHFWNLDKAIGEMRRVTCERVYIEDSNIFNIIVFLKLLFRFGPDWLWNKQKVLENFGKMEDIHSVFWWKRKIRDPIKLRTRKEFWNSLLDTIWKFFGPDCIFSFELHQRDCGNE